MTEQQIIWLIIILTVIAVIIGIALTPLKIRIRKNRLNTLTKSLSPENKKLIIDKNDLEYLENTHYKFTLYCKKWYYNNTPYYSYMMNRCRNIIKKYSLNINE